MRKLTAKQKKLLKAWYNKTKDINVDLCEDYDKILKVNEYELFYQDANRYLADLMFSDNTSHDTLWG